MLTFRIQSGFSASSYSTVAKWTSEFKFGRESLDYDLHSGRTKTATTSEFIAKVHKIAETLGMSSEWIYHILTEELGIKKCFCKMGAMALDVGP
jgi:hypothetical protein